MNFVIAIQSVKILLQCSIVSLRKCTILAPQLNFLPPLPESSALGDCENKTGFRDL